MTDWLFTISSWSVSWAVDSHAASLEEEKIQREIFHHWNIENTGSTENKEEMYIFYDLMVMNIIYSIPCRP